MIRRTFVYALLLTACASSQAMHPVQQRAPFDLNCDASQMRYRVLNDQTIGANGCGRRATYIKLCRQSGMSGTIFQSTECQWVADVASNR